MAYEKRPDSSRRSERSRTAILDAAMAQVAELGYQKTTIEGIAARAGVGKQTIYRWWRSKGEVLFDAVEMSIEEGAGAVEGEEPALPDTGDIAADLKTVLRATVDEFTDPRLGPVLRALNTEIQIDEALAERNRTRSLEPGWAAYEARLRAAQEAGQIDADADVRTVVEMLTGPLTYRWLFQTGPLTHAYADTLADMTLKAVGRD
ncbi:TetR family transcriptional regulator [Murinocardiopsis flavida]|uniref:TetR family transcriptional regulator n=1 Tax=Murinocardiopsis flavida TaxID=645275 RepID=A0A2P8DMT9_9ACTN|nr:TetR/AcrR family transcriptional regulator [Murinocardiopsis flavida]PSK98519.1 TetR family transcriptional regulator [Murinocardiopsis flavida]